MDVRELEKREQDIQQRGEELRQAFEAIAQPRSDYQIAHFVVCQHDTPIRQWMQAVLELQLKVFGIARVQLDLEEMRLKRSSLLARIIGMETGDDRRFLELDAERLRISIEETNLARLGNVREAETLYRIVQHLEKDGAFTRQEVEADEARYWSLRLRRQAFLNRRGLIDPGNAEALLEAMTEPGETRAPLIGEDQTRALLGVAPQDEAARLLAEREQIETRLAELAPALRGKS